MAAETQYTANTGMVQISTANTNLDGSTGTYYDLITAGANGTLIKKIIIKAYSNTTSGMIRLFAYNGTSTKIIAEIPVPAVTKSASEPTFETTVSLDYMLVAGGKLKVTTQIGETFNVIAEGFDWAYYTTSVRPESTNYTAATEMRLVDTANSNLDGTGALSSALVTGASNGTLIQSIVIKATVTTTPGMIRFFLYDGTNKRLFKEVQVSALIRAGNVQSFSNRFDFDGQGLAIKSGWIVYASTQNSENFFLFAEALNWAYPA